MLFNAWGRLKSFSIYTFSNASNFIELLPEYWTDNVSVANSIQYMGSKMKRVNVILTISESGPEFNFVFLITLVSKNAFLFITKCMMHCYLTKHPRAYKIYDTSCVIMKADLDNTIITYVSKLRDGKYYTCKKYM